MINQPNSDIETFAYFCQHLNKTPFELIKVYSENEMILRYEEIDIHTYIIFNTDDITRFQLGNSELIICWDYYYNTGIPTIKLSDPEWYNQYFDSLLVNVHSKFAQLEQDRLQLIESNTKIDLFNMCIIVYDGCVSDLYITHNSLVNQSNSSQDIVSKAFSILIDLYIITPEQEVCITNRLKVIAKLKEYIGLESV